MPFAIGRKGLAEAVDVVTIENSDGETLELWNALLSAHKRRTYAESPLEGMSGTVKEYSHDGDWKITLRLGISDKDSLKKTEGLPYDALELALAVFENHGSLRIHSDYLSSLGVNRVVVRSWELEELEYSNWIDLKIELESDEEIELLKEE